MGVELVGNWGRLRESERVRVGGWVMKARRGRKRDENWEMDRGIISRRGRGLKQIASKGAREEVGRKEMSQRRCEDTGRENEVDDLKRKEGL